MHIAMRWLYDRFIDLQALVEQMATNSYSLIFRAVSKLSSNTAEARREIYERARKALAAQTDSKSERNALERAIHAVEKSPYEIPGARGQTWFLALSILGLSKLWMLDATGMSAYWVVRPWNRYLMVSGRTEIEASAAAKMGEVIKADVGEVPREKKTGRFLSSNLNEKRLALSMSILGAIIVPLCTGSLMGFIKHPVFPVETYYHSQNDANLDTAFTPIPQSREVADATVGQNSDKLNWSDLDQYSDPMLGKQRNDNFQIDVRRLASLVRDIAIGLIFALFLILVLPRIVRRYLKWLAG